MTKTSALSIRVDTETKERAEAICNELGTTVSHAVNMFLCSMVRNNGFPFELKLETPNKHTLAAMQEAREIAHRKTSKGYANTDEMIEDLLSNV